LISKDICRVEERRRLPVTTAPSTYLSNGTSDATDAVTTTFLIPSTFNAASRIEVVPLTAGVKRSSFPFGNGEATWIT
jgi:hypothetical protein